jgi:hypothetical protein
MDLAIDILQVNKKPHRQPGATIGNTPIRVLAPQPNGKCWGNSPGMYVPADELKTAKLLRKDKIMNTRRKKLGNILVYWILKNHPEMGIMEAFEHAIAIANRVFSKEEND